MHAPEPRLVRNHSLVESFFNWLAAAGESSSRRRPLLCINVTVLRAGCACSGSGVATQIVLMASVVFLISV